MIDERMEELAALYALGALTPQELAQFEVALRDNAELRALVASLQDAALDLAGTAPLLTPPPSLKKKILAQLDTVDNNIIPLPAPADALPRSSWFPWSLAACLAVLCVVLAMNNHLYRQRVSDLESINLALQSSTNDLQQTIASLNESNRLADFQIALLSSQLTDQPKATAVSLWDDKKQNGLFVVENLKAAPADKDYQLWVIDPQYKTPVDAGVFHVDATGRVRYPFKATQRVDITKSQVAVTAEEKGGSPTPKGTMVLLGK